MLAPNAEPAVVDAPVAARADCEAVASAFPCATEAGLEVLRGGGNAMDAAVAAAWALCVCEPSASGLGGQTVILVHHGGRATSIIDGQSRAPAAASPETITRHEQQRGHRSCTIPTTPATLDWAQRRYGVLSRAQVMAPAIRIAEEGYAVTRLQHRQAGWVAEYLRDSPADALFLQDGLPPPVGSVFCQPKLGATLRRLAECGIEDFYQGEIARQIAADMEMSGGLLTAQDLASCDAPAEVEPLSIEYGGCRILSTPPPSGGLQLLVGFNVMAQLAEHGIRRPDSQWREAVALVTSAVFRERERRAGDKFAPEFGELLMSREYARQVAAGIATAHDREFSRGCGEEPGETTHLSVCDRHGLVVALTQSIQSVFGAKIAHPDLGFLYNNYLRTCPRTSHAHALAPRCRPRSNIAPTLVLHNRGKGGRPLLALGAAGSRRITSAILQVVCGVVDQGLDIEAAVMAPRVHGLVGRKVWIERPAADDALLARLHARGREPVIRPRHSYAMGAVHALQFRPDGSVAGAADPRRDGTAGGLH